jgi:hypothetical protein
MLAPGCALVKLCPQLTTFKSLLTFRPWWEVVCSNASKQGWSDPELAGMASRHG